MAAVGEGRGGRREVPALGKTRFEAGRQPRRVEGGARHFLDAKAAVGAGDREQAVLEDDVGLRRFQQMGGDLAALLNQLLGGVRRGGAADRERARTAGAAAEGDHRAVALQYAHLFRQ